MQSRFYFTAPNQISNEKEVDFVVNMIGLTDCAAVLLPDALIKTANHNLLKSLIDQLQTKEIAVIAESMGPKVNQLGLDGVEFYAKQDDLKTKIEAFDEHLILGVNCLKSKHDAMTYGEMDAHYVAFKPIDEHSEGQPTIGENQYMIELASWWDALFSIPAVAYLDFDQNIENLDFSKGYPEFIAIMPNFWLNTAPKQQLEALIKKLS